AVEIEKAAPTSLRALATFYHRRANFPEEARTLKQLLVAVPRNEKGIIFYELMELIDLHRLDNLLAEDEFGQIIKEDADGFNIMRRLIRTLAAKERYARALALLDQYETFFPAEREFFIYVRAQLKSQQDDIVGAQAAYVNAFDPFWSSRLSHHFYTFLSENDLLRNYQRNLQAAYYRQPDNFLLAMRLCHYFIYNEYEHREAIAVLDRLEQARDTKAGQNMWTAKELATVGQLLLTLKQTDRASRYLYTLYLQGGLPQSGEERAALLYRLFQTVLSVDDQSTPLRAGNLNFYKDIAQTDQNPGLLGGMLSLVLANSGPSDEFAKAEQAANRFFHRAAAYRIFVAYQQEYPTAPVLPLMYADLIKVYARMNEQALVERLTTEYEQHFAKIATYPDAALQIADLYLSLKQPAKARKIYQRLLDYYGQRRISNTPLVPRYRLQSWEKQSRIANRSLAYLPQWQIDEPLALDREDDSEKEGNNETGENGNEVDDNVVDGFGDDFYRYEYNYYDIDQEVLKPVKLTSEITYAAVLDRYIATLATEGLNEQIVALYWQEISKYPREEGLYERFLQWLSSTNLINAQLRAYQLAIANIPDNKTWQARLARWFIKQERKKEFAQISQRLLKILDEEEIREYLQIFITLKKDSIDEHDYDAQLYFQFYQYAHNRFPDNLVFVNGLLDYYHRLKKDKEYLELALQYYFRGQRDQVLAELAQHNQLEVHYTRAIELIGNSIDKDLNMDSVAYQQFRADAAIWLADYEAALDAYRKLHTLYPGNEDYANRLVMLLRSFGQHNESFLKEAADIRRSLTRIYPTAVNYRTEAGELCAELGDFETAREQWNQLPTIETGNPELYLDTASIFWDYYQYDDALRVIDELRKLNGKDDLYAFQAGAIYENKRDRRRAIAEYVKDLANYQTQLRTIYRLKQFAERPAVREMIAQTIDRRFNETKNYAVIIGYARLLDRIDDPVAAAAVIRRYAADSRDIEFLHLARGFFGRKNLPEDEIRILTRLAEVADHGLPMITYRRQLASLYEQEDQPERAREIYDDLLKRTPNNYGVIITAGKFYVRQHYHDRALSLLKDASTRGLGAFHFEFGVRLADYQALLGRLSEAEATLTTLYRENPGNESLLAKLMEVLARAGKERELMALYQEALQRAHAANDRDRNGRSELLAQLHTTMAETMDKMGAYRAALDQHIFNINNDPLNQELLQTVYDYARRHQILPALIDYYLKLSVEADRNYRWKLVLARIHEFQENWQAAANQYQRALINEPQDLELYEALAEVLLQNNQPNEAIAQLERAFVISGRSDRYQNLIAAVNQVKSGERQITGSFFKNLPTEEVKNDTKRSLNELFAQLSVDIYAQPSWSIEYEIDKYAISLRGQKSIGEVFDELWRLRTRVEEEAFKPNNAKHKDAQSLLESFDRRLPTAFKGASRSGEDLFVINQRLRGLLPIDATTEYGNVRAALVFKIAESCGAGDIVELILRERLALALAGKLKTDKDRDDPNSNPYHLQLAALADFYTDRGLFDKAVELLKTEYQHDPNRSKFNYWQRLATLENYLNNPEAELATLRAYYREQTGNFATTPDALLERYFTLLATKGEAGRQELASLLGQPHPYRLQLINFLIRLGDRELAYQAIATTDLPELWRLTRRAEATRALGDYGPEAEQTFRRALGIRTIGECVSRQTDPKLELTGDDWFLLASDFGRWLAQRPGDKDARLMRAYILGIVENRPQDANAQRQLGRWYIETNNLKAALTHLELARTLAPDDNKILLDIAEADWKLGRQEDARRHWQQVIGGQEPDEAILEEFFNSLSQMRLVQEACVRLSVPIAKKLSNRKSRNELESSFLALQPLLRKIAFSFDNPSEAKDYFLELAERVPARPLLKMVLDENLISEPDRIIFLRKLVPLFRSKPVDYDTGYLNYLATAGLRESNEILECEYRLHSEDYTYDYYYNGEDDSAWLKWRRELVNALLIRGFNQEALDEILKVEKMFQGHAPRPDWLMLAHAQVNLRLGKKKEALETLALYCGLNTRPQQISLPVIKRCAEASKLLTDEKLLVESRELMGRAYRRLLALSQFEISNFIGYAQLEFERKNITNALKTLDQMIDAAQPGVSVTKLNQIAESYWTPYEYQELGITVPGQTQPSQDGSFSNADQLPAPKYDTLNLDNALAAAAETAARAAAIDNALKYEQMLMAKSGKTGQREHRLAFARLLVTAGKVADGAQIVMDVLALPDSTAELRTRALALLINIGEKSPEVITTALHSEIAQEMKSVLKAVELQRNGKWSEAANELSSMRAHSLDPMVILLEGLSAAQTGNFVHARNNFAYLLFADPEGQAVLPYRSIINEPRWQLIQLYLNTGQDRAALFLASKDKRLQAIIADTGKAESGVDNLDITLNGPIQDRVMQSQLLLLEQLSLAAERVGDYPQALNFEKTRVKLLGDGKTPIAVETRIKTLNRKIFERSDKPIDINIDLRLVSQR
ncbi:MAG: tetratricopeptide repeat protein, partial [Acidobacteriota bacterium]